MSLVPLCIVLYSSVREVNKNVDTACFYLLLACMVALMHAAQWRHGSWVLVAPLVLWYLSKPVQKASKLFVETR